jgi:ABC-type uncharacterized transport system involved in gliding motility auxiliary subunit
MKGERMKFDRREIVGTLGSLGAVLLLAGGARYMIQNEWSTVNKGLLIAGGVLLLLTIIFNSREIAGSFGRRSTRLGTNTALVTVIVLGILVMLNFVGFRHHKRFDWTTGQQYTISDQTKKILGGLKEDVNVIRFAKSPDPQFDDLMKEYTYASPHVHYQVVDPQQHPELAKEYGITRLGQVVLAIGSRHDLLEGTQEQDVTTGLLKLTRNTVETVCFVEGHGEKSITDTTPQGYSDVNAGLAKENYLTKSINLISSNGVPADCSVVVIAGPNTGLLPQESQVVGKYLDGGGKVLLMIDPDKDPKLDDLFKEWNINASNDTVIDPVGQMLGTGAAVPLVRDYGDSPITQSFGHSMTFFPLARTVSVADDKNSEVKGTEFLKTSSDSFTKKLIVGREVKFDPATDQKGPLSLGVTVERKMGDKDARLVVIGDSDFATNQVQGLVLNGDLFYNAINWLAQEGDLISIRPKSQENRRVNLTESQQRGLQLFAVYFLPLAVFLFGLSIWWKRR